MEYRYFTNSHTFASVLTDFVNLVNGASGEFWGLPSIFAGENGRPYSMFLGGEARDQIRLDLKDPNVLALRAALQRQLDAIRSGKALALPTNPQWSRTTFAKLPGDRAAELLEVLRICDEILIAAVEDGVRVRTCRVCGAYVLHSGVGRTPEYCCDDDRLADRNRYERSAAAASTPRGSSGPTSAPT